MRSCFVFLKASDFSFRRKKNGREMQFVFLRHLTPWLREKFFMVLRVIQINRKLLWMLPFNILIERHDFT